MSQMEQIMARLEKLDKLDDMDKNINVILQTISAVEKRLEGHEEKFKEVATKLGEVEKINTMLTNKMEELERESKRRNLMIFNLEEKEVNPRELKNLVLRFFKEMLKVEIELRSIETVYRVGKKQVTVRPIRIIFSDVHAKWGVLNVTGNLRGTRINISHDLTANERIKKKEILSYRHLLIEEGNTVKIKGFKLEVNGSIFTLAELRDKYGEQLKRKRPRDSPVAKEKKKQRGIDA